MSLFFVSGLARLRNALFLKKIVLCPLLQEDPGKKSSRKNSLKDLPTTSPVKKSSLEQVWSLKLFFTCLLCTIKDPCDRRGFFRNTLQVCTSCI